MLLKVNSTFETQQEFKPGLAGGLGCRKNLGVALGSCASASEPDLEGWASAMGGLLRKKCGRLVFWGFCGVRLVSWVARQLAAGPAGPKCKFS